MNEIPQFKKEKIEEFNVSKKGKKSFFKSVTLAVSSMLIATGIAGASPAQKANSDSQIGQNVKNTIEKKQGYFFAKANPDGSMKLAWHYSHSSHYSHYSHSSHSSHYSHYSSSW